MAIILGGTIVDYEILIAAFTLSAMVPLMIYGSDKELKYLHQLNI